MDQSKEQTAAALTQILFSKLAHRFFDKYTDYEMQSEFLMRAPHTDTKHGIR